MRGTGGVAACVKWVAHTKRDRVCVLFVLCPKSKVSKFRKTIIR